MKLQKHLVQRLFQALFVYLRRKMTLSGAMPLYVLSGIGMIVVNTVWADDKRSRAPAFPDSPNFIHCQLQQVVDGDTVSAVCARRYLHIRLAGIDAPEMGQMPWGERSRAALARLVPAHFSIRPMGPDYYKRQLAVLYDNSRDLNIAMVEQGWAVVYRYKDTPVLYRDAEKRARLKHLGVWSEVGAHQNPRQWRKLHPYR